MVKIELLTEFERIIGPQLIVLFIFFGIASYTDIKDQKIYDWVTGGLAAYNAMFFVLIPLIQGEWGFALQSVLGGILSFTVIIVPAMIFLIKAGGDIKFIGAAGLAFGLIPSAMWLAVSAILLFIYGLYLKKIKNQSSWTVIPFAPFLFAGLLINLLGYILFI